MKEEVIGRLQLYEKGGTAFFVESAHFTTQYANQLHAVSSTVFFVESAHFTTQYANQCTCCL